MIGETIRAPWTPTQVRTLNEFQHGGYWHPFTCRWRGDHYEQNEGVLVATADGWYCPHDGCGYRQDWCWTFMADEDFNRNAREQHEALLLNFDGPERPDEAT